MSTPHKFAPLHQSRQQFLNNIPAPFLYPISPNIQSTPRSQP
jgi:hypothetical protein